MRLAERYKGLAVLWEHRFYGNSLPFPVNVRAPILNNTQASSSNQKNTTADQWRYLTTDQALEDVVFFANSISIHGLDASLLKPNATPWVWVGGSYPGIRGSKHFQALQKSDRSFRRAPPSAQPFDYLCGMGFLSSCASASRYGIILRSS